MTVDLVATGARVRAARERAGLSQRALHVASGVSRLTLHRLESGVHTTLTLADMDRLAQGLGVTLEDLLYGSPVRERVQAAARTGVSVIGPPRVASSVPHPNEE
jgi:transcriptional regulator with XRE-family HTH domain